MKIAILLGYLGLSTGEEHEIEQRSYCSER